MLKKSLFIIGLVAALGVSAQGQGKSAPLEEVKAQGYWNLSDAEVPTDGPTLIAWKATDRGESKVEVFEGQKMVQSWELDGVLVKGASWVEPSRKLRLDLVEVPSDRKVMHGVGDSRVYEIDQAGELVERFRTQDVEGDWQNVFLSDDGRFWIGYFLEERPGDPGGRSVVGLGKVGETKPFWTWKPPAAQVQGQFEPMVEGGSYAGLFSKDGELMVVLFWNGRLSLVEPEGATKVVEVALPEDCVEFQTYFVVEGGIWTQCRREDFLGPEPSGLHAWHSTDGWTTKEKLDAAIVDVFIEPWYLKDGTVVDLWKREGKVSVHAARADSSGEAVRLGFLEMPLPESRTRWLPSGDALLISAGETEVFHVERLDAKIRQLKAAANAP